MITVFAWYFTLYPLPLPTLNMHSFFLVTTLLTVFSQICSGVSQTTTAIPMIIQLPSPIVVQAEIAGTGGGLTTYLLHDPPNVNTDDGFTIGGTITYILGAKTASFRMVASDDDGKGGSTTTTAEASCNFPGTQSGDLATCTVSDTTTDDSDVATLPVTSLTVTIEATATGGASAPAQTGPGGSGSVTPVPGSSPANIPQSTGGSSSASIPTATHPSSAAQNLASRFIALFAVLSTIIFIL